MNFNPTIPRTSMIPGGRVSYDVTHETFADAMGPVMGKGGLRVRFFYARMRCESPDPEVAGTFQDRLCVEKMPIGDALTAAVRFISEEQAAREFPREWAHFQQYEAVPTDGTALDELPGMTQRQISLMAVHGIRSVEDLVAVDDNTIDRIGLEARQARKLAARWLKSKSANADRIEQSRREAAMEAERKALMDRLAAMERQNVELSAQVRALSSLKAGAMPATAFDVDAVGVHDNAPVMDRLAFDGPAMAGGNDDLMDDPLKE